MTTLLDQSISLLQKLQKEPTNNNELDNKTFKYLIDQFNNIKKTTPDISQEDLIKQSNTLISILKQCSFAPPPAPVVKPNTTIPGVPNAKPKVPKTKDWTELEDKCKELPDKIRAGQNSKVKFPKHNDGPLFDKELDLLQPDKPTFDWGIKFTYDPSEQNFGLTCIPNTGTSLANSEDKQEWYMTLLPAMKSQIPKSPGMDTPNAMPGLQFQLKSNIAKHRIPGSQPVYQHLGIDTVMVTIVGCFTGDGGKKTRTTSTDLPINYANSLNPNISADGKTIKKINLTEEEQKVLDVANSVATNLSLSNPIHRTGSNGLVSIILADNYSTTDGAKIEQLLKSIESKGYVWRSGINKFVSNTPSRDEFYTYNSNSNFTNGDVKTSLQKESDSNLATLPGEKLTSKTKVNNEGVNTTWMKDVNMYECEPCQGVVPQTERLDSYHEFTSFQRLSYNKELEVEINLAKNTDSRNPKKNKYEEWGLDSTSAKVQKDADWGPLRNGENGNPRFKGVIRGMEAYYARHDRTWYLMTLEVTDLGLSSDVPLNLIKELTEAAEAAAQDVKEEEGTAKALTDPNERLDCILQQGNGKFTAPDDVWGTTNRAYIAGNIAGGGELIAWDTYTGEGIKYKMEEVQENGKTIKYAKASSSSVLSPYDVAKELASTKVNLISAASGGVGRIRVDSDVKKQFFITMYERGAIDYKPLGIGEDVLQSEVQGNITTGNNAEAEKAFQQLCSSFYSTSKRIGPSEPGATRLDNPQRLLTSMTLSEVASKFKAGTVTEGQLGVLVNEWTASNSSFTTDKGIKVFQDLRIIKQGTCKGFAFARSDVPGSQWKVITPYGLFKQLLTEMNSNTEADLNFLLEYIDIKTNPFQSGFVSYVDGSGSNDPGLKNRNQQVACFDTTRGDMDPNTPGVQSIKDVNGGQHNQYDPLAAGDSIPLEGLNPLEAFLGTVSTLIACGVDFLPAVGSFLAGFAASPFTAGTSLVAGTAFSGFLAVLAGAACADSFGNLTAAAAGKREYDWLAGLIDLVTALIPEIAGRKGVRESAKRIAQALGVKGVILSIGKTILDLFAKNSTLRNLNPVDSVKAIWGNIVRNAATSSGIPTSNPIIITASNPNFFQSVWNWILKATGKTVTTLIDLLRSYYSNTDLTNLRTLIDTNKADTAFMTGLDSLVTPQQISVLKSGDVIVTKNGELFIVEKQIFDDSGNYSETILIDVLNNPHYSGTIPDADSVYKADSIINKKTDIEALTPAGTTSSTSPISPAVVPGVATPSVLSTNDVDLVITKLRGSDPDIITELTNAGIKPINRTSIVGDTVVKIGDNDTYVVVSIDGHTGTITVKNVRTGAITVADNTYYNVNDLNKITSLPSIPAFSPIVMGPPLPTVIAPPAATVVSSSTVPPAGSLGIPPASVGTSTTVPIFVPTINTKTGTVINKLQANNPDIVTILAAEGINPIGLSAQVGDSLVKVGDIDTYTVDYASLSTSTFKVKNNRTGIIEDLDNTFFSIDDIKKVEVKNNPAFTYTISDLENSTEYALIKSYMTGNADIALRTANVPFLQANPVVNVGELIVNQYGVIYEVTEVIPGTNSIKIRKSDGSELTIVPSLSTQFYKADDILAKKLDIESEINKSPTPATTSKPSVTPKPLTVVYGDSNNYINSVVDDLITTNKIPEPSSENIYNSYYDAWYNEVKNSTLNSDIKDLMEPIQIDIISKKAPSRISNILTGQFIDQRGEVLVYHSIDNSTNVIYFTKVSNNTVEAIPFSSTQELFNISTPLGATLTHYLKRSILKPI